MVGAGPRDQATGPSNDVNEDPGDHLALDLERAGRAPKTLEQARRRGRRAQVKSVQRYTKAHDLVVHESKLTPEQSARAKELQARLPSSFEEAVEASGNRYWIDIVAAARDLGPTASSGIRGEQKRQGDARP